MIDATARQRTLLAIVAEAIAAKGVPPTNREIAAAMGIKSTNAIADLVLALEKKGLIERTPMISRGLRITAAGLALLSSDDPNIWFCPTCRRPL